MKADDLAVFHANHPEFTQYFVAGARAMILHNINADCFVTNGRPAIFHSLTFNDEDEAKFNAAMEHAAVGEITTLTTIQPAAINVELEIPKHFTEQMIPLLPHAHGCVASCANHWVAAIGRLGTYNVTVPGLPKKNKHSQGGLTCNGFDVSPAYAMTVHKMQGHTMPQLVLDLAQQGLNHSSHITFEMFFVAVSRVARSADLRLAPLQEGYSNDHLIGKMANETTMEYINNGWDESSGRRHFDNKPGVLQHYCYCSRCKGTKPPPTVQPQARTAKKRQREE
jgi:hypothetical protein